MMKSYKLRIGIYFIILLLPCHIIIAQEMRAFGNYSQYFANERSGSIKEIQAGIDFENFGDDEADSMVAIQLSASYITIGSKVQENYDYDNYVVEKLSTKGYAINTALGLKIYNLFLDESLGGQGFDYFIMPKLNVARIRARENFTSTDYFNSSNSFQQQRSKPAWQCYLGIEIGYEFFLSENNSNSIVVTGNFNRLNFNKAFKKMPHNNMDYSSESNFGLGVSFYFGIKKLRTNETR